MVPKLLQSCIFVTTCLIQTLFLTTAQVPPKPGCRPIADVIFLLDGSDSISEQEFSDQLQFVRQFVQMSDISPDSVRVGLTVVSSTIGDEFPLSLNSTKENLMNVLNSINQPQEGSRTDLGLVEMEQLFNRHARRGVLRIGVILTDGRAKYIRATEGEARVIKDAGVFLIAIGVGRLIKFSELEKIASTKDNAFNLQPIDVSTKYLAEFVTFLGQESCTGHIYVNELNMKPPVRTSENKTANNPGQTFTSKAPVLTTIPALQITDPSNVDLNSFSSRVNGPYPVGDMRKPNVGLPISNGPNSVGDMLRPNSKLSISNEANPVGEMLKPNTLLSNSNGPNTVGNMLKPNIGLPIKNEPNPMGDMLTENIGLPISYVPNPEREMLTLNSQMILSNGPNPARDMLKPNSLLSFSNTFDVKMEPFEELNPIKSKVPIPQQDPSQTKFAESNLNLKMLESPKTNMPYVSYTVGDGHAPFTRFTAPQLVYTPSPSLPINRTTPADTTKFAALNIPLINTTPKTPVTTLAVTNSQPMVAQHQEQNPTPSETANKIINALIANKKPQANGFLPDMDPAIGVTPNVIPSGGIIPEIVPTQGVGINFPGPTAAETLEFIKKEIKPARTYEEHMNPIFQMFDATNPDRTAYTKAATVQPTPTTLSPKEAFKIAEMAALKVLCSKGRFVDGIAYISKPGTCSEFVQCYKEANELRFRVARCPFETFFDDAHSVCRHHEQMTCLTDPCAENTVTSYDHHGNCRAYWLCERGRSKPACCPAGTLYVTGFGCAYTRAHNTTCTDTCMDFGNLNQVIHASQCKLLAMDADPHFFFEHVAGMGWVVRMCAQGSTFDQILCKCKGANEIVTDACKPELHMDFTGGLEDISGNNLAMGIHNVELDGGTGAFFGKSHLKLWRFSGMSLGQHVTISFRFRISVTAKKGRLMHIVSNCCYNCASEPQPSLDIAIIPGDQGGVAVFSTTTKEAGEIFLFVPFKDTFTGWNNLEYRYDGQNMRGTVNGRSAQKSIVGSILGRSEPLLIGSCGLSNAYDGFLDEFKFYMCNP